MTLLVVSSDPQIISEMTYIVSSGMLNTTVPYVADIPTLQDDIVKQSIIKASWEWYFQIMISIWLILLMSQLDYWCRDMDYNWFSFASYAKGLDSKFLIELLSD